MSITRIAACFGAVLLLAAPALAEVQVSAYGGMNTNFDSRVSTKKGTVHDSRNVGWDGASDEPPPYWGVRATYWFPDHNPWGVAFDYAHTKAVADLNYATDPTYSHLQFTDGNNIFTINAMYRFKQPDTKWSYYVGAGAGVAVPDTEVTLKAYPAQVTNEYELAGPAAQVLGGVQYNLTQHWATFAEAKLSYSHLEGDLNGGGSVKTNLWSPQAALGVSYGF